MVTEETNLPFVRREDLVRVCRALENQDTILVGGQALVVWAEVYRQTISQHGNTGPVTSRDLDFFGFKEAASALADNLDAKLLLPGFDDHSPSTALVEITFEHQEMTIDFLGSILGVSDRELKDGGLIVSLDYQDGHERKSLEITLLHPQLCLQSRVANILHPGLGRRSDMSFRQLQVAVYVLRAFLLEKIAQEDTRREVHRTLKMLWSYLRSDEFGKKVHLLSELVFEPLEILKELSHDERLDRRYRKLNLIPEILKIEERRVRLADSSGKRMT